MLPLKVCAAFGRNATWMDTLLPGLSVSGSAGAATINSGRLLVTLVIATLRQFPFVTTMDLAALVVFTGSDPKLSEPGAYFTCACTG